MKFRLGKIYTVKNFPNSSDLDGQDQGFVFQHAGVWFKKIGLNKVRCLGNTPVEVEEEHEPS